MYKCKYKMITLVLYLQILTIGTASSPHYKSLSEKTSSSESSVTHKPILTGIAVNQTIALTCNIYGSSARSVGWYRNKGRKVISIGFVNNSCETSPRELPFSAKCLCLNITVYSCTLTVDPSMHDGDEWKCSFADNGLSIKSNGIRIGGSNVSRTETGEYPFFVDVQNGSVVVAVLPKHDNDIIEVQVNNVYVASCTFKSTSAEMIELKHIEMYNILLTPSGMCLFTIFNFNGTQLDVKISSTKGFEKAIINGKAYPHRTDSVNLDFILRGLLQSV